jgi:hypothetical protein
MTFESSIKIFDAAVDKIFEFAIMAFVSVDMVFDAAINMTFVSADMVFDAAVNMTFESANMVFDTPS